MIATMTEWKHIELAPRDGTRILAFIPGDIGPMLMNEVWIVWWERDKWVTYANEMDGYPDSGDYSVQSEVQPTHWMHLPIKPGELMP